MIPIWNTSYTVGNASRVEESQEGNDEEVKQEGVRAAEPCAVPVFSWTAAEDLLPTWIRMVELMKWTTLSCLCIIWDAT